MYFCHALSSAGHLKSHSIIYMRRSYSSSASLQQDATVAERKCHGWRFPGAPEVVSGTEYAKWTWEESLLAEAEEQGLLHGLFALSSPYLPPVSSNPSSWTTSHQHQPILTNHLPSAPTHPHQPPPMNTKHLPSVPTVDTLADSSLLGPLFLLLPSSAFGNGV